LPLLSPHPTNARVTGFLQVIKNPMFFHTIEDRLKNSKYTSPMDFHKDVSQSFTV